MSRIQIPLDVITSRLNFGDRFQGLRSGPLSGRFSNLRPVNEFLDFKRLSKPNNFVEMQSRVNYNLSHYSSNYAVVFVMLSIYALLTNWLLLFDIILVVVGMWFIGKLDGHDLEIGGLSGRPQSPEFAPQWGRPSRRRQRRTDGDAASRGRQGGDVRVEELHSGDDARGVGASSGARFASDPLRFTGVDMGNSEKGLVRRGHYEESEDSEDDSESSEDEEFEQYLAELASRDREEALVQSALYRIERAKAKGRTDVDLNDEEMAAMERRRKRDEAAKKKKSSKKRKDSRVAVPLTQLEPSSRKKKDSVSSQSRQQSRSNSNLVEDQDRHSRSSLGSFPPTATAGRPRSGTSTTTSSQRPQSRVRAPSTSRQPSDSSAIVRRGRNSSQAPNDPFQFQVPGTQAPSPAGSWRQFSGAQRGSGSRKNSQLNADDGTSESDDSEEESEGREDSIETTSSDDIGSGAQIVVEESSPEPTKPEPTRRNPTRSSTSSSTSKKKPATTTSSGRRKK
ncbi:PRA1 family protein-domain-containing protein [Fusarium flagelliforme]|nr:PRA1 family protein-domain-containing protein [Fusarium flagelliforme]KAH7188907.1 PRA1 family protein-domain-containing protein [Fusarium flagelliforme]